jgi:hypothetical protein
MAPFVVVHVNAAFTRTTGMSSVTALGRPFHELVKEETACQANSLAIIDGKVLTIKSESGKKDALPCKVTVGRVGPNTHTVTHFTLKLEKTNCGDQSSYGGLEGPQSASRSIQVHG